MCLEGVTDVANCCKKEANAHASPLMSTPADAGRRAAGPRKVTRRRRGANAVVIIWILVISGKIFDRFVPRIVSQCGRVFGFFNL